MLTQTQKEFFASIRRISDQVDWTYDQLWNERPIGEILNVLLARGLSKREAVVCLRQAQEEMKGTRQ